MGDIEWAMWANEQAIAAAFILLMGGIVGVSGMFKNWQFAAFAIPASLIVLFMEWPRSKRKKGNTVERRFQQYITRVLNVMGPFAKNYYVRFVLHILLSVPCCFLLPTIMGGMCLMISSIIYLVAALKGEEWKPVIHTPTPGGPSGGKANPAQPPSHPPPRAPPVRRDAAAMMDQEETRY